jgi:hypothetical protein
MACNDLRWADSQVGTRDDFYKRQQQAVTYMGTQQNSATYKGTKSKAITYQGTQS